MTIFLFRLPFYLPSYNTFGFCLRRILCNSDDVSNEIRSKLKDYLKCKSCTLWGWSVCYVTRELEISS